MNNTLPNFLCVGASKTGTSSMHQILKQHSQIYLPNQKETNFFYKNYHNGINWYREFFKDVNAEKAIGEICPTYIYHPDSPKRILEHLGKNIKLIFIFRNPADKMFSNYKMNIALFGEKNTFAKALELDKKRIQTSESYHVAFHYINKGFYYQQVSRYLNYFNIKNMLFLVYEEDFFENAHNTYSKIQNFLKVNHENLYLDIKEIPGEGVKNKVVDKLINTPNFFNQLAKKIVPSKNFRRYLKNIISTKNRKNINIDKTHLEVLRAHIINDIYKESILELEKLINRKLNIWYNDV